MGKLMCFMLKRVFRTSHGINLGGSVARHTLSLYDSEDSERVYSMTIILYGTVSLDINITSIYYQWILYHHCTTILLYHCTADVLMGYLSLFGI